MPPPARGEPGAHASPGERATRDWPRTATPPLSGVLRAAPEDFVVEETLPSAPTGNGEHVWLRVSKRGSNTDQVAGMLARRAGTARKNVSFAGMKDRHAVAVQWFSVWLPRADIDNWQQGLPDGVKVLGAIRHARKLQRGYLAGNRFVIMLRDVDGDRAAFGRRVDEIRIQGVPNYFGDQRFGHAGENPARAEAMLAGRQFVRDRHLRGIYLSAARSFLFNQVLARRVVDGTWNRLLDGEACCLEGSRSFFVADTIDEALRRRLAKSDVHPSGPLWGRGELASRAMARTLEEVVAADYPTFTTGLAAAGLTQERRALRMIPRALSAEWVSKTTLQLAFELPAGCYATSVLREVALCTDAAPGRSTDRER